MPPTPSAPAPRRGLVRAEFGPTLPALLRGLGRRRRRALSGAALLAVALAGALAAGRDDGLAQLVHRSEPSFTMVYAERDLHVARPRRGELVRLEGRRGPVRSTITAAPAELPPYRGVAIYGLAPVLAERRIASLRRRHDDLVLQGEGRARVNTAPGYEIAYRTGPPGARTHWREILLVEDDGTRAGVVLRLRNATGRTRPTARRRRLVKSARSAYRSFRFGTERP